MTDILIQGEIWTQACTYGGCHMKMKKEILKGTPKIDSKPPDASKNV